MAEIMGKIAGPLLIGIGAIIAIAAYPVTKLRKDRARAEVEDVLGDAAHHLSTGVVGPLVGEADDSLKSKISKLAYDCKITIVAGTTTLFAGIGFTIVGNIEPLAADVLRDLTISAGVFAGLALIAFIGTLAVNRQSNDLGAPGVGGGHPMDGLPNSVVRF